MGFAADNPSTGEHVEARTPDELRDAIEALGGDPDTWAWWMTAIPPGEGGYRSGWPRRRPHEPPYPWEAETVEYPRPPRRCAPIPRA